MELGKLGAWGGLFNAKPEEAIEHAQRLEALGYSALWLPEAVGYDPFVMASLLLERTERLVVATGIANIYEVATHLRGEAGQRQVKDAKIGLTHVIGLGSACAIHILEAPSA